MDDLYDLVALSVPPGSRVLALAPDPAQLRTLAERDCQTWSLVADDGPTMRLRPLCQGVVVGDLDEVDLAGAFPGVVFDAVVATGTLASVASPAELLRRVTKVLGTDGRLVASVPNATHASRRLLFWQGLGQDEEVVPGRPLVRAFNGDRIDQLLSDNGLFLVERLRVRRPPVGPTPDPPLWPTAVLAFLAADEDADTDHYVVVASPAAGARGSPVSLAAELQHRLHRSEDELAELQADLATLEHAMECLQLDIGLKDDFALELRGRVKSAEAGLARVEGELAQARAALERTRDEVLERERELDELRGRHGTGLLPHLVARLRHQLGNTRRQ